MGKRTKDTIYLGSGTPYVMEFSGALPTVEEICTEEHRLGYSKGGAAVTYTEETYEEKDDLGYKSKIITVDDDARMKLGLLAFNGAKLKYLADRCSVTEADGKRTILLGGSGNSQGKDWVVCFHHEDKKDGDLWAMIVGRNTAGISLTFAKDNGTKVEPEFKALPQDDKGTKLYIVEEIDAAQAEG